MKKLLIIIAIFIQTLLPGLPTSGVTRDSNANIKIANATVRTIASPSSISLNSPIIEAAKKTIPAVVTIYGIETIRAEQVNAITSGSGFIATHDGYILTNNHVVANKNATYTVVLYDGTQKNATVVYRDAVQDVAIIKIDGTYAEVASLGSSSDLKAGQTVAALGNAYGMQSNSVSLGSIAGFNKDVLAHGEDMDEQLHGIIQSSAPMTPGYSGGPVIDTNGSVIGMNVAVGPGMSFHIPVDILKNVVSKYQS